MASIEISYNDSPAVVWYAEVIAAIFLSPWNNSLPTGLARYQLPDGSMGVFDLMDTPGIGQTFVGRLRLTAEQSASGKPGWSQRRLLAKLGPGRYLLDAGTPWERTVEWPDDDVAAIGVLLSRQVLMFDPDGWVYTLKGG